MNLSSRAALSRHGRQEGDPQPEGRHDGDPRSREGNAQMTNRLQAHLARRCHRRLGVRLGFRFEPRLSPTARIRAAVAPFVRAHGHCHGAAARLQGHLHRRHRLQRHRLRQVQPDHPGRRRRARSSSRSNRPPIKEMAAVRGTAAIFFPMPYPGRGLGALAPAEQQAGDKPDHHQPHGGRRRRMIARRLFDRPALLPDRRQRIAEARRQAAHNSPTRHRVRLRSRRRPAWTRPSARPPVPWRASRPAFRGR